MAVLGQKSSPRARRERVNVRAVAGVVALAAVLLAVAAAGFSAWKLMRAEAPVPAGQPVTVAIAKGSSTASIAEQLAAAGVVRNALAFRLEARRASADGKLKAGTYELETGMGYDAAIEALVAGPQIVTFDVTIPEGFTARQVAERFAARAGVDADEMLSVVKYGAPEFAGEHPYLKGAYTDSLEGYLFPSTYTVREGATAEQIAEMMLDKFDAETGALDWSYAKSKNLTFSEVVIIASVLEREAKLEEEFPLVASVIYNRLGKPMRLQLCATVLYTMPEGTDKLTNADTQRESPYNTYIHDGLPPGPISNPGMKALEAAAHPPKTGYYYYVLTGADGSQTFTATYDEFLRAKAGAKQ